MRRFFVLLFLGIAAALGLWYGMRSNSTKASSSAVTALLPKETLAFVHVPDFNRAREKWHETHLYKLWREPAVQEFMQRPRSRMPKADAAREKMREFQALEMKDGFLAITSWQNNQLKMLGGFRFKGTAAEAEKVIGNWRARAQADAPEAKRETVQHEQHRIEVMTQDAITIATVYAGDWFFAANDVAALKTLLDRADRRVKDVGGTLAADENFRAAFKHMPVRYAVLAYGRLDQYFERLTGSLQPNAMSQEQVARVRQIRSIAAASAFEDGRFRDVLFVAMPKMEESGELTRKALSLGTKDSFLYMATMVALGQPMSLPDAASPAVGMPAMLQRWVDAFSASGITPASWNDAFGAELSIVGDWAENARWPALLATLPVDDATKARQIVTAMTSTGTGTRTWAQSESDGVQYFTLPPDNPLVPISPTIGIADKLLVLGLDKGSVEGAIKRSAGDSELSTLQKFKVAERLVPDAKQSFTYIDIALLYQRLDAALRPMLVMAAAFVPTIAETVDLSKLPPAEVITKHLAPIVMSQSYETDGYVTESVGPLSIFQAALGGMGLSGAGAAFYDRQFQPGAGGLGVSTGASPALSPPGSQVPSPEPEESP